MAAREPLPQLARAIAAEAERLEIEDVRFVLDPDAGTVTVRADRLKAWGPRTSLEARLSRCGLEFEVHMPDAHVVVFAATTTAPPTSISRRASRG